MIRWQFIITRLIVVVALIVLLGWGLVPIAHFATIRSIETITGAKVDIDRTHVGFFPPRIAYSNVSIADPRSDKEMRDAFRADLMSFAIDGEALLHRRFVAREGRITGIQIDTARDTSGHYESTEAPSESDSPSMLSRLFGAAAAKATDQAEAIAGDLETVRRSKEIRARWEKEYESLVLRARQLEKQIRTVRDEARGIDNPLRDWPALERTLAQAKQARSDLMTVRQSIDSLPDRLQADLAQLDEAKQIDLAKAQEYLPGDYADSGDAGIEMISRVVRDQIERVRGYLEGGRTIASYTVVAPESDRQRGTDYDLDRLDRPGFMVRYCEVGGLFRSGGETYSMTGIVENMTPTPELLAEPTRALLRLEGPDVVRVDYIRDRRKGADVDLVKLHWPNTVAKPVRIGNENDAGVTIAGGNRELWVQIRTDGDQLQGRLVSKQSDLSMTLNVNPKYADTPAAAALRDSLAGVDRVEVDARFEGTWSDLDFDVKSNLSGILSRATRQAIDSQLSDTRAKLTAKINQEHAAQVLALRQWLGSRQSEARSLLASADKSIEEMSQKVLDEVGDADAYLGKTLRSAIGRTLK